MNQALGLAAQALFLSNPNPAWAASSPRRMVINWVRGFTQQAGGPHAEVMALRDAAAAGRDVRGHGVCDAGALRPPGPHGAVLRCADTSRVAKVVASIADPNPLVAGQGFERLRAAGIEVVVGPGAEESRELNIGFQPHGARHTVGAPEGGGIAGWHHGAAQRCCQPVDHPAAARADGHAWRARSCAVLTGIGTVLADNPVLNVREVPTPRQPQLVVVDSHFRHRPTLLFHTWPRLYHLRCRPFDR